MDNESAQIADVHSGLCRLNAPSYNSNGFDPVISGALEVPDTSSCLVRTNIDSPITHSSLSSSQEKLCVGHFMRLPAELRNNIYEDVLQSYKRANMPKYYLRFPRKGHAQLDRSYPPLLLVCKQIRRESLPMFFAINRFRIVMAIDQLSRVRQWLSSLEKGHDDNHVAGSGRVSPLGYMSVYITECTWSDAENLLPLAQFAQDYARVLTEIKSSWTKRKIRRALYDVVCLGRKAMREKWPPDMLKSNFAQWSKRVVKRPHVRVALERANAKMVNDANAATEHADAGGPKDSREVKALGGPVAAGPRRTRSLVAREH